MNIIHGYLIIHLNSSHSRAAPRLLATIVGSDSPYWPFISRIDVNFQYAQCEVTVVAVDKHGADIHECKRSLSEWLETVLDDPKQEKFSIHATVLV